MKTCLTSFLGRPLRRFVFSFTVAWLSLASGSTRAAEDIGDSARTQIQALLAEKEGRTAAQKKMDSQLVYLAKQSRKEVIAAGLSGFKASVSADAQNRVLVDMNATVSRDLLDTITRNGGTIVNQFAAFHAIRALLPVGMVETLAARRDVRSIGPAAPAITNVGSVLSQGDRTHRADTARATFFATGGGVKIGVLSDGVNSLATSIANGNLNASATFLAGQAGSGDEGTAMMEIIQDLVPDAQLIFATAFSGDTSMANNILALQAAGCSVIVDDVTYFNESPFQDGVIAQAVNTVSAAGALYFSSARNSGNKNDGTSGTWEGDFVSGGAVAAPVTGTGTLLDFGGATTFDTVAAGGSSRRVDFFWSDPTGGSANDYDLFVLNSTGTSVLRSSTNVQTGTQNPYEATSTLNVGERIVIVQRTGAANRFLHLDTGRAVLALSTAGNVRGHNASGAANAFSVAATNVANSPSPGFFVGGATNPVETFSSDGPRRIFFNPSGVAITPGNFSSTGGSVLNKPDITAADGVATSVTGFTSFFGTSAAAPHAAAIAGLIKSYNPTLAPAQIRNLMTSTALDIEAPGLDRDSGIGIVMALAALQAAPAPDPLAITGANLTATGTGGGPFTPSSTTYTLTNNSAASLNWTAARTQSWTTLSATSGTLGTGASTSVTVSLNAAANALVVGSYSDSVTFTNTTSGYAQNRLVSLTVSQPRIVYFPLDSDPGWARQGQWAYGTPTGGGGTAHGAHDPTSGATGTAVLGVNLSGDYSLTVGGPYYLTTGPLNFVGYTNTKLQFQRWLNTDYQPYVYATIEVSNNGTTWTSIWNNGTTNEVADAAWTKVQYNISAVADNQPAVYVRWGYQIASGAFAYAGWNLDDVEFLGTAVNTPPTITGAVAGQAVTDQTTVPPFTGVTIADTDTPAQTQAVSVTLDAVAKGAFTTLNGFTNAGAGVYTFSGTAAAATTAIRGLVFTPTANRVAPGLTETTTFTISANDGIAAAVTNNVTTVISTSINDAPTITGAVAGQAVNDNATLPPFTAVTVADVDAPAQTQSVSVTLDTAAKGAFTTLNGFADAGGGVYTFSGTAAAAATAIRGLVFTPTANRVAPGLTETTAFTISTNDGIAAAVTDSITTVVSTSVNDAPVITGQQAISTPEATSRLIALGDLTVTDPDNNYPADFTLSVQDGVNYTRAGNIITPAANFTGTLTVPAMVHDGLAGSNVFNLAVTVTPGPLKSWRLLHGLAADGSADLENPSGDGVKNLLKYALNLAPVAGDLAIPRVAQLSGPDGATLAELTGLPFQRLDPTGHLQIVFLRRSSITNPGITCEIEFSSDAENWAVNPAAAVSTLDIDATWERVTVTDSDVLPLRLARLRVTTLP